MGPIQFISHSTDPIQGHQEHMDMEIDKNKKTVHISTNYTVKSREGENN
jgi:hypothetical protein